MKKVIFLFLVIVLTSAGCITTNTRKFNPLELPPKVEVNAKENRTMTWEIPLNNVGGKNGRIMVYE